LTTVGVGSLGASLEYPSKSFVYLHATGYASLLLPRVRFKLGPRAAQSCGELVADDCLGMGLRWR
jgi:hypothetical protein